MKDNRIKGIIVLAIVTVISFGIIYGTKSLVKTGDGGNANTPVEGALEVAGFEGVSSAWELKDDSGNVNGYAVKAQARGFSGFVELQIDFDLDGNTIKGVSIVSQNETVGYGAAMAEDSYLSQFPGKVAPVHLSSESGEASSQIDAISGATASSEAVKSAINRAHAFISDYVSK